ncbi:toprim domain-containing protein [Sphingopyxis sp. SCN 67-31]|uniref:DUF7146 domain-containing protein n=1 Tax=Sphingopyxis sp. SCN 67-31 TaxID=1660142 RepID=UPI00086CFA19|nr:toprim domain-containing protein [Sphingopyxis sp. SCN 67-31]ODU35113.1 MAG: DNA primase [Sphingopyxis sp. SCN 67-31]
MPSPAADVARRLADDAEAVCRRYLSHGRREGHYWMVGDVRNTPGRSLYVRLSGTADGLRAAGKWTDAASGDHGDLLDIISASCGHASFRETLDEARRFLSLPRSSPPARNAAPRKAKRGTPEAARRLWAGSKPLGGTTAQSYLAARAITELRDAEWLRCHPHCFYHPSDEDAPDVRRAWPALIAGVTDEAGRITGVHRTWLDSAGSTKAPVAFPRRAMGQLLGHGVRFGAPAAVMAAGEGLETILSLRQVAPAMPMIAALSAAHLGALAFPRGLERLYIARDDDPAGEAAISLLSDRARPHGIKVVALEAERGDFNADLMMLGRSRMVSSLRSQLLLADCSQLL